MDNLSKIERRIVTRVIDRALVKGWRISVWDDYTGEGERVLDKSDNRLDVFKVLGSTGGDTLQVFERNGRCLATIVFVWGNGEDCLSDYTDNEVTDYLTMGQGWLDELTK